MVYQLENIFKEINLNTMNFTDYCPPPKSYYMDITRNEVVQINTTRVIVIDNNDIYRRLTQFEYDKHINSFEESKNRGNARLYRYITEFNDNHPSFNT